MSGTAGTLIALTVIYPSPISIVFGAMGTIGSVGLLCIRLWYQKYPYCGTCGRTFEVCRFECQSGGSGPGDGAGQESNGPGTQEAAQEQRDQTAAKEERQEARPKRAWRRRRPPESQRAEPRRGNPRRGKPRREDRIKR